VLAKAIVFLNFTTPSLHSQANCNLCSEVSGEEIVRDQMTHVSYNINICFYNRKCISRLSLSLTVLGQYHHKYFGLSDVPIDINDEETILWDGLI